MVNSEADIENEAMHIRQITLADGRYMIFYSFGDEKATDQEENDQREDV